MQLAAFAEMLKLGRAGVPFFLFDEVCFVMVFRRNVSALNVSVHKP
jgi:hypothetical protein